MILQKTKALKTDQMKYYEMHQQFILTSSSSPQTIGVLIVKPIDNR